MTEDQLHIAVVKWLRLALPEDVRIHHSPNESKGTPAWYRKRAQMGVMAGWPDLMIIIAEDDCGPGAYADRDILFIELKSPRGRVTPNQHECHRFLQSAGFPVRICRSLEDVERALIDWGIPLKARIAA